MVTRTSTGEDLPILTGMSLPTSGQMLQYWKPTAHRGKVLDGNYAEELARAGLPPESRSFEGVSTSRADYSPQVPAVLVLKESGSFQQGPPPARPRL